MPLPLKSQAQFEELWFNRDPETPALQGQRLSDKAWIVYFGASWCGPCKRLDVEALQAETEKRALPLWKCDVDENDYTPGFCQVRSIPTFICFTPGKVVSTLQSSDTPAVLQWIQTL
jgi:thioredoxin-like negative regulator of GroEL